MYPNLYFVMCVFHDLFSFFLWKGSLFRHFEGREDGQMFEKYQKNKNGRNYNI